MAINLRDYRRTSAQRGWGAGWPSCSGAAGDTAVVIADRSGTRVSVRRRLARLVDILLDTTEQRGYRLKPNQCGGYNCRSIGGTRTPSNHSWAVAVDLNWNDNPMRRPLRTNMPKDIVQMWNRYGFAWGGHYNGTPDPMHFEFMGTPAQADQMTALAIRELLGGVPSKRNLRLTRPAMRGNDVKKLQRALNAKFPNLPRLVEDGIFGKATDHRLRHLQRDAGLVTDGILGPRTRAVLRL